MQKERSQPETLLQAIATLRERHKKQKLFNVQIMSRSKYNNKSIEVSEKLRTLNGKLIGDVVCHILEDRQKDNNRIQIKVSKDNICWNRLSLDLKNRYKAKEKNR